MNENNYRVDFVLKSIVSIERVWVADLIQVNSSIEWYI